MRYISATSSHVANAMPEIALSAENARILVSAGPAHGDILLATPLFASLRQSYPGATIDALVYTGQEGMLEGNPDIDEVITASKHPKPVEYLRLLGRILRRYDLGISTKETDRSIWYVVLAGRRRIAAVPAGRDAWKRRAMDAWVFHDPENTHTLLQNGALAALAGAKPSREIRLPRAARAKANVDRLLPAAIRERPYAVLHVSPGLPHKRWTRESWEAVGAWLGDRALPIVLTGGSAPDELEYLRAITERLPCSALSLAGKLSFAELAELLAGSTVYVGTDTVATHMAAAAGVPTVALFGPENPGVWGPWPRGYAGDRTPYRGAGEPGAGVQVVGNVTVLQSPEPCPTCRQGRCLRRSERKHPCRLMLSLDSDTVVAALSARLAPPDETAPGLSADASARQKRG